MAAAWQPSVVASSQWHRSRPTADHERNSTENWTDPNARALAIHLDGDDTPDLATDGTPLLDDDFLVLVNGWWEPLQFRVPEVGEERTWRTELDTYDPRRAADPQDLHAGDDLTLGPQSIAVLRSPVQAAGRDQRTTLPRP